MPVRTLNLVAPLPHEGTAMRITDTAATPVQVRSGAVSQLVGASLRQGDVDSANERSTPAATPGTRTSTTATRTTTTRRPRASVAPSADSSFSFSALVQAYLDCRRSKRNTASALAFEAHLERNLCDLYDELANGEYRPGSSICFVITRPKPREVWAADFRDRIVHHLLYNRVAARFIASFDVGSCACIPGRGTLYAARRLEVSVRSITENWSRPAHYLKCDLANFFVGIDKQVLHEQLAGKIAEPWWLWLADVILFHDPRENVELRGRAELLAKVPPHKSLFNAPADQGLPIGNLSSQFFANVHLDALDKFAKHQVRARHYVRYVDDFVLLHPDPAWLNQAHARIREFLPARLGLRLNDAKTILQPVDRGIDFVGQVIKPWRRTTRLRTLRGLLHRLEHLPAEQVYASGNSSFGLVRQAGASRHEQALIARAMLKRGHAVDGGLTRAFRRRATAAPPDTQGAVRADIEKDEL
jgi:RNA-directed DNA polymerase